MRLRFSLQKVYVNYKQYRNSQKSRKPLLTGLLIGLWITLLPIASYATAWDPQFYNPKPADDDLILPMPCDGSLVLKKVFTPTSKPLDDIKILLGSDQKEFGFAEYATPNYISGSFSDANSTKKERYFVIGKYEITSLQYQAVMNDICPTAALPLIFPITNISWFDAVAFTDRYSQWLLKNGHLKNSLAQGYIRLPTNSEWEYAARGGSKVTESEFREVHFPMQGNLENYAWFSGAKSANGKLQLIGRLSPNQLDIYDMLGNASEMMFDPFRMNKLNRYHGQQGAITVRGGSYLTPESSITSAFRIEKPYYDGNSVYKGKDVGFRVVLTTQVMNAAVSIAELDKEWNALGNEQGEGNVINKLEDLTKNVEDEKMKRELNQLNADLRSANQARDEQRDRSIQSALQLGAFLCANVSDLNSKYEYNNNLYKVMTTEVCDLETNASLSDDNMCSQAKLSNLKVGLDESEQARDFILKYYADTIVSTSSNYAISDINNQGDKAKFILESNGKANMSDYLKLYLTHINQYIKSGKIERSSWLQTCNNIRGK